MAAPARQASYSKHYETAPDQTEASGSPTWITRGANMVVAISDVADGAVLERDDNPDEYFVFLPSSAATIAAGSESIEAGAESVTVVPPGRSRITARGSGRVVRVFSNRAEDLAHRAANADRYAVPTPDVAPIVPWPEPNGGRRLRTYGIAEHTRPGATMRVFRSRSLMLSILLKREVPRDTTTLSPHAHDDFEQASVLVQGRYIHHLRYPWTTDMAQWRDDEAVEVGSPSVMIIPPTVIHTSRSIGDETSWLIDVFSPPRVDLSMKPGVVCNADDYPMPPELPPPGTEMARPGRRPAP